MNANPETIAPPTSLQILSDAAASFWGEAARPPARAVVSALLEAESATRHQRLTYPFPAFEGDWRLWFTTATAKADHSKGNPFLRGWYVPQFLQAQISFHPISLSSEESALPSPPVGIIGNQAGIGSLRLKFSGPCHYLGKRNLLAFDFTQLQLDLLGRRVWGSRLKAEPPSPEEFAQKTIAELPFFAFFLVNDRFVAARGRGGGLAIWVRNRI